MFAKRVLDSVQHTDHMDAGESHYSQVFLKTANPQKHMIAKTLLVQ
jgi:hypothetical protein